MAKRTKSLLINRKNSENTPTASNFSLKIDTHRNTIERRARKEQLSDRRAEARYDESGVQQADRRLANRLANAQMLRKAG